MKSSPSLPPTASDVRLQRRVACVDSARAWLLRPGGGRRTLVLARPRPGGTPYLYRLVVDGAYSLPLIVSAS